MSKVVAPMDGLVEEIDTLHPRILVYVDRTDSHRIYAPVTGMITNIRTEHGVWMRKSHLFNVPDETKVGRMIVVIDNTIELALEVGKGQYITDTIRFNADRGAFVQRGEFLGEMLIGSRYEMRFLDQKKYDFHVFVGDKVEGGRTILAQKSESNCFFCL